MHACKHTGGKKQENGVALENELPTHLPCCESILYVLGLRMRYIEIAGRSSANGD